MSHSPDSGARSGDPRRGARRYGPSTGDAARPAATYRPASGSTGGRPRVDDPYLGGLDPDDEWRDRAATTRAPRSASQRGNDPAPTRALPIQPAAGAAWSDVDEPTVAYTGPPAGRGYAGSRPPLPPLPPPPGSGGPGSGGSDGRDRDRAGAGVVIGRIIAAVLAVAIVVVAGIGWWVRQDVNSASGVSDAADAAGDAGVAFRGGLNILLVGSDARTDAQGNELSAEELSALNTEQSGGTNTDTIMVLHIPEGGAKATAVSLPRDTWIGQDVVAGLPGPYADGSTGDYKPNKINSFYGTAKAYTEEHLVATGVTDKADRERRSNEAGRLMLTKVVQKFTGLKINHYAEVNLLGFYLLSKAIGGVPVCLNAAVDDPFSGAKFPAGRQEVAGSAALAFVRQRHGLPQGDLDRVRRQQAFLASAADKVLSAGTLTNPSKISNLIDTVKRSVVFDKGFDLFDFAEQMRSLSAGNVTFTTIPTHGSEQSTDTDALATDPAEIRAMFANLDAGGQSATSSAGGSSAAPLDKSAVTVDVQNAANAAGMAGSVRDKAVAAGFAKGDASDYQGDVQATTTIHYPKGAKAAATAVRAAVGGVGNLVEDTDVATGHVLVVVGTDMPTPGSGLRAPGAFTFAAAAPSTTAADTAPAITAGQTGCVN